MTVCTGIFPALHTGILSGKAATGPKELLPIFRQQHSDVKWERKRWVRDGKIWTSGTITNGLDSMAAFMRERFAERAGLVEMVLGMADVGDRGRDYARGGGDDVAGSEGKVGNGTG